MPNALATPMLLVWPVVSLILYLRLDPARALIWTILGAYLVLPPVVAISLPLVPDLDKFSIPNLMALVLSLVVLRDRIAILPQSGLGRLLLLLFVLSPFATVLTNADPIRIVTGDVPGLRLYDSVANIASQAIALIPFFLARKYLATPEAMRALAVALVTAGMVYSLPMLVEVAIGPRLNILVYGFFQHEYIQMIRSGGFRPIVFLPHGLWAAFFVVMALLSALALLRAGPAALRPKWLVAALWLALLLALCKSMGPILYAAVLAPMILFAGRRSQFLLAALLALIVVTYPILRGAQLVPLDGIVEMAGTASAERAGSLAFRIQNEEALLDHAAARPWFGWGQWGRNLIRDPVTGEILSIPDGGWVIVMGVYGWIGYFGQFGLLVLPLLLMGREALRQPAAALSPFAASLALIYAANMVDMLPNATLIPFSWLMAGALLGHAEAFRRSAARPAAPVLPAGRPRTIL